MQSGHVRRGIEALSVSESVKNIRLLVRLGLSVTWGTMGYTV